MNYAELEVVKHLVRDLEKTDLETKLYQALLEAHVPNWKVQVKELADSSLYQTVLANRKLLTDEILHQVEQNNWWAVLEALIATYPEGSGEPN